MKKLLLLLCLLLLMSVPSVSADTLSYDPITITVDNCDVEDPQTIYFDVLIDDTEYSLQSSINDYYLDEFPLADSYPYLSRSGYQSYLAYFPEAEFFTVNCYTSIYSIDNTNIAEYRLIAFDDLGNELAVSDIYERDDVGFDPTTNTIHYYQYEPGDQTFQIVSRTTETSPFAEQLNFLGTLFVGIFLIILMAFVGILPFMVFSTKGHKNYYVIGLLASNFLFMLTLVILVSFLTNILFSLALVLLLHLLLDIAIFKFLDTRLNPTYRVLDIIYIHLAYLVLMLLLWALMQGSMVV